MKKLIIMLSVLTSVVLANTETGTSGANIFDSLSTENDLIDSSANDFINSNRNGLQSSMFSKFDNSNFNQVSNSSDIEIYNSDYNNIVMANVYHDIDFSSTYPVLYSSFSNNVNVMKGGKFYFSDYNDISNSTNDNLYFSDRNDLSLTLKNKLLISSDNEIHGGGLNKLLMSDDNSIQGSRNMLIGVEASNVIGGDNIIIGIPKSRVLQGNNNVMLMGVSESNNGVAIGKNAHIGSGADNSVAIGSNSNTFEAMTFSVGSLFSERRITNVADPFNVTDAVNLRYLQDNFYTKSEVDSLSGGGSVDLTGIETSIANLETTTTNLQNDVSTNTSNIANLETTTTNLQNDVSTNTNSIASLETTTTNLQNNVETNTNTNNVSNISEAVTHNTEITSLTRKSSVTGNDHGIYVSDTETKITGGTTSTQMVLEDDRIVISHVESGEPVVFTGVANGVDAYDAVNRRQLDTVYNNLTNYVDEKFDYVNNRIDVLDQNLRKEIRRSTATAIALSNPLYFNSSDNFAMSIGYGSYENEQATAINFGYKKDSHIITIGTSLNRSQKAHKVGYSFSF